MGMFLVILKLFKVGQMEVLKQSGKDWGKRLGIMLWFEISTLFTLRDLHQRIYNNNHFGVKAWLLGIISNFVGQSVLFGC